RLEGGDGSRLDRGVRVQEEEVGARRLAGTAVAARAEAAVRVLAQEPGRRNLRREEAADPVAGRVVDDDDPGGGGRGGQRSRGAPGLRRRPVVNDDGGGPLARRRRAHSPQSSPLQRRSRNTRHGRISMPSSVTRGLGSSEATTRRRTVGWSTASWRSPFRWSEVIRE